MSRRGENIRKRKDGRWEARILTDGGKYKSIYAAGYRELKEKITRIPKTYDEDHGDGHLEAASFIFVCRNWLSEKEISSKQSTISIYRGIIERHLMPYFEKIELCHISDSTVNSFIRQKSYDDKLQPATINTIVAVLMQIIRYGQRLKYIENKPYLTLKPGKEMKELQVLTPKEQESLVGALRQTVCPENVGILLSLYTGLRIGEICALQWRDIDMGAGVISITKTMQRIQTENGDGKTRVVIDSPKSQKSQRKIPLPHFLLEEIEPLFAAAESNAYVLTGVSDRYTEPRAYQYKFKKYLKQTGLRDINFHALRHTFATRAIEQNMDVKTLSEILGHSTVSFTMDRYVHPSFEYKKHNMEKLAVFF